MSWLRYTKKEFLKACKNGRLGIVKNYVERCGEEVILLGQDEQGLNAAHWAAARSHIDVLHLLKPHLPQLANMVTKAGNLPLALATTGEIAHLLCLHTRNFAPNVNGDSALYNHIVNSRLEIACIIFKAAPKDRVIADKPAILQCFAQKSFVPLQLEMINAGIDIYTRNNKGDTLAHMVCADQSLETLQALVARGFDANTRNNNGDTLLHVIARNYDSYNYNFIEYLMKLGLSLHERNANDDTPLDLVGRRASTSSNANKTLLHLQKHDKKKQQPAPPAPVVSATGNWHMLDAEKTSIARTTDVPQFGLRVTDIFNFAHGERMTITQNVASGNLSAPAIEKFHRVTPSLLKEADENYRAQGGTCTPPKANSLLSPQGGRT